MQREKLQVFRKEQGLKQSEMAAKLDLSQSHYKGIEGGKQAPSIKVLQRFYEIFKDDCDDILGLFIA